MDADVIVIGGGAIGTASAYFLAQRGQRVLLLERRHLNAGASGVTAAMIPYFSDAAAPLKPLAAQSPRLILQLQEQTSIDLEIIHGGSLTVAFDDDQLELLAPIIDADRALGIDTELLTGDQARRAEPLLSPNVYGALYQPLDFHVNPFRLCQAYLHGALEHGAQVRYGVTVQDIAVSGGEIDRVITDAGDFRADWVVVAGGAHTAKVLENAGVTIPVSPGRGQVIITERCDQTMRHIINCADHVYVKQVADGNFYLGSHTEYVGFDDRITLEKITAYATAVEAVLPIVGRLRAIRFFVGFRPMSPDNLPLIGPMPNCGRLIVAAGHGRAGILLSAATGKTVSELIVDGRTEHPIDALRVDRFKAVCADHERGEYASASAAPIRTAGKQVSLLVIGGGPAGWSAARSAAEAGVDVLVIDEHECGHERWGALGDRCDRITIWPGAVMWAVIEARRLAVARGDELVLIDAGAVVVATGAHDRPVPVPGWTLTGVYMAGDVTQLIEKAPGRRVVLAGTGPGQLTIADQLRGAGMQVVAVADAAPAFTPAPPAHHGTEFLTRHVLARIEGRQQVQRVVLAQVDEQCKPIADRTRTFEADAVCIGYGFVPDTAVTRLLGCCHDYDSGLGAWLATCDQRMTTDQAGVFAVGACVGASDEGIAVEQGALVGLFAALHLERLSPAEAQRRAEPIRKHLDALVCCHHKIEQMHPYRTGFYAHVTDDTVVCPCECVTGATIRQAIRDGTTDVNDIKKRSRMGMGDCQGINCLPAVAAMLEREFSVAPEKIRTMTARPPARAVGVKLLVGGGATAEHGPETHGSESVGL